MKHTFTLLFFLLTTLLAARKEALDAAFAALQQRNYPAAINQYESLLSQGYRSADLYYNLGIAYYENGQIGKAILNYERGLRLEPSHEDLRYNLQLAVDRQVDEQQRAPTFFLTDWWQRLAGLLSPDGWAVTGLLLLWLAAAGLALWLLGRRREMKKYGLLVGGGLLMLCLLPFWLGASRQAHLQRTDRAILLAPEATLRASPAEDGATEATIHEGVRLRLIDQYPGWYKVELDGGQQGWVMEEQVAVI